MTATNTTQKPELSNESSGISASQRIHEFLGKCWHDTPIDFDPNIWEYVCGKCGDHPFTHNPDYTTDLNAVREAEERIYSTEGLAVEYIAILKDEVRRNYSTSAVNDWHDWFKVATAPASVRCQAIVRLLEER